METETKFVCSALAEPRMLKCLQCICLPDALYRANRVNTIYYDTHDYRFAMEKAASHYLKTKIRLRWYQNVSGENTGTGCFLEFKYKTGSNRQKTRILLNLDLENIGESVNRPSVRQKIRSHVASAHPELTGYDLTPHIHVSYIRYRFTEPVSDTRIALDTKITARSIRSSFTRHVGEVRLNKSILEVKGKYRRLPWGLRHISGVNLKKTSFSKYYECFLLLTGYKQ
jgi:hypothetical protein